MISLEQAVERILAAVPTPKPEPVPLTQAAGRFVAGTILAPVNLPGFDNSAMDGYAVRAADLAQASASRPAALRLAGRVEAGGAPPAAPLREGECIRVFTGSAIPAGADAVVMQEDTKTDSQQPDTLLVLDTAKGGENIRCAGEDVRRGSTLVAAGTALGAGHLCLLAANGLSAVQVNTRPVVGILATGSELQEPGETLRPGGLFESNRVAIAELVASAGGVPCVYPIVRDTLAETGSALTRAFAECDLVVTCGGVSVGELDFVKDAFEGLGGSIGFWRVAIKPGKPFVFGQLGGKLLCGLPGNPVSAFVTFLLLVRPVIRQWQGAREVALGSVPGILKEPVQNADGRRHFMRVFLEDDGSVRRSGLQASHALSSLAAANGLIDVPPGAALQPGTTVRVLRWV